MRKAFKGMRALRQRRQPFVMFGSELVARPDRGIGRQRIEIVQAEQTGSGLVVVSSDENFPQAAGSINYFVGGSAVTHYIAKVGDQIEGRRRCQRGFQCFEIGVNIAEQKYAQGTPDGRRL